MTDFLEELLKQQEDEDDAFFRPRRIQFRTQVTQEQGESLPSSPSGAGRTGVETESVQRTSVLGQQRSHTRQRSDAPFLPLTVSSPGRNYTEKTPYGTQNSEKTLAEAVPRTGSNFTNPESRGAAASGLPLFAKAKRAYSAARLWQARTGHPTGSISAISGHADTQSRGSAKQEIMIPSYAALVDAAFARDARRYDGPLRIL